MRKRIALCMVALVLTLLGPGMALVVTRSFALTMERERARALGEEAAIARALTLETAEGNVGRSTASTLQTRYGSNELTIYLLQNGEQFQTDETNFVPDTARNLLRLKIIPEIQNGINSSCEKVICRNAKLLNEDEKYLNDVAKKAYLNAKTENGVDAEKLIHLPMPIKSRAVMHMLRENGVQNDVFQPHIEALMKLLEMQSGAKIEMSTVIIRKSFGRLLVENKSCTKHECEINSVSDSEKKQ